MVFFVGWRLLVFFCLFCFSRLFSAFFVFLFGVVFGLFVVFRSVFFFRVRLVVFFVVARGCSKVFLSVSCETGFYGGEV